MLQYRSISYAYFAQVTCTLERQVQQQLQEAIASDGAVDHAVALGSGRRGRVARHGIEAGIQLEVRTGRVQAGMIKKIERVRLKLQVESLIQLEILENREVEVCLERRPENVAAVVAETRFLGVANVESADHLAWRNTILAGLEQRHRERIRVFERLAINQMPSSSGPRSRHLG